jgi:hypothetical protein
VSSSWARSAGSRAWSAVTGVKETVEVADMADVHLCASARS